MKTLVFAIATALFLVVLPDVRAQRYSSMVSDKEIYRFLNDAVTHLQGQEKSKKIILSEDIPSWNKYHFVETPGFRSAVDSILAKRASGPVIITKGDYTSVRNLDAPISEVDKQYAYRQFLAQDGKAKMWHKPMKRTRFLSAGTPEDLYYWFSVPLFSVDGKYAIFEYEEKSARKRKQRKLDLYEKGKNGRWRYLKTFEGGLLLERKEE